MEIHRAGAQKVKHSLLYAYISYSQNESFVCRFGIAIAGWSADGDPKMLTAMIYQTVHRPSSFKCIQDMTHVATKLRNRLLCSAVTLAMGTKTVLIGHLNHLIKHVNKSVHGLTSHDVNPVDRQNFKSFEKLVDKRVIEALDQRVANSEATIKYLQLCSEITSSFLDYELPPLERVSRIYRSVFFLRIWRSHLLKSRSHTLKYNFISSNAYSCIELNAKNMIELIKRFRDEDKPELFLPPIFDSQTCEKTFRQFRSLTTMDFTRINFSIYELLHMIGRIEVQNDICYFKLNDENVIFPMSHKRSKRTTIHQLPSDNEISCILAKAKESAIKDAQSFGMTATNIDNYEFKSKLFEQTNNQEEEDLDQESPFDLELLDDFDDDQETFPDGEMDPKSPFTIVPDEYDQPRRIRKSTLLWILCEPGPTPSKDRLTRVRV